MSEKTEGTKDEPQTMAEALSETWDALETEDEAVEAKAEDAPENASEEAPEEAEEVEAAEEDDVDEAEEASDELVKVEAPEHWSKEDKDVFESLADDTQREWLLNKTKAVESAYDAKFKEVAEQRRQLEHLDGINRIFEPYRDQLALHGTNEVQYVERLVAADKFLRTDPASAIQWLAGQYGIDLPSIGQTDDEYLDPAAAQRIAKLESEINRMKASNQSQAEAQRAASANALQAEVDRFKDEKDESGSPLHPHFEDVRAVMAGLMQSGQAAGLESAYEQAVWAMPKTREQALKAQTEAQAKAREAKRKADVEKARKVKNIKSRSTPTDSTPTPAKTHHEELERLWDQLAS